MIVLTSTELRSLHKVIASSHYAWMRVTGGEDILGYDNYMALAMWDDKLAGRNHYLDWYSADLEGKSVEQWLAQYARSI